MIHSRLMPLYASSALLLALFVIGAVQFSGFASLRVVLNLLTDNAFLIVAALGMTLVILSGKIDLSVGSVLALSGVLSALMIEYLYWHPLFVFVCVLFLAFLFGSLMGAIIHYFEIQAFIVTLAGMFFARGLATILSEDSIAIEHPLYDALNGFGIALPGGAWFGIQALAAVLVLLVVFILVHYMRFGKTIFAMGGNRVSAELMGVPIARTTVLVFGLSSMLAALAGIMYSFYTSSGYALSGVGLELDAIAAVVIGGTLLSGGRGFVLGTLIGVLVMGLIQTYIAFHGGLNSWWTKIVIGAILLCFIVLQRFADKSAVRAT
jgi:ribose/xylose/arabinose/galactoside ABC-type transport system permease subunit